MHIQKYIWSIPASAGIDKLVQDLSNFAQSRGSSIYSEFGAWISSLTDIEYRLVILGVSKGGTRRRYAAKKTRKMRRKLVK